LNHRRSAVITVIQWDKSHHLKVSFFKHWAAEPFDFWAPHFLPSASWAFPKFCSTILRTCEGMRKPDMFGNVHANGCRFWQCLSQPSFVSGWITIIICNPKWLDHIWIHFPYVMW
jgi:hypothetical protein